MITCRNIFPTRVRLFGTGGRWTGCTPLRPSQRMAKYSERYAAEMAEREALGAAFPRVRLVDGRPTLVALDGHVNTLPKREKPADEETA